MQDKIIILPSKERTESGQTPLNNLPAQLTPLIGREQEIQVACVLLRQAEVPWVAEQLVISRRTVNWYMTSIYSKLGVSSRTAATRYAMEHHLV